jgi:large subunit ribosomal protein L32
MAVQKSKASKARTRGRKAINMKLSVPSLIECGNCGKRVMPHRICPKCGYYKGKQVIEPEEMA